MRWRRAAGLTMGVVGVAALASCGNDKATDGSDPPAIAIAGTDTSTATSEGDAGPDTTATASSPTMVTGDTTVPVAVAIDAGDGRWMPYAGSSGDYIGPPLEEVLSRTTDAGITIDVRAWPNGGSPWPGEDGPGWVPAAWCNPTGSLRVTMRLDDAVGIGTSGRYAAPFGGLSVQAQLAGYAEGTPFTVLVVQAGPDVDSVAATFTDGTVDSADTTDGLAVLAAPTAPAPEDLYWIEGKPPPGTPYTLSVHRGADIVEISSTDLPYPSEDDYQRECSPPTELPAPGEQPADPAVAEQAVRDAFSAVFDFADRAEGDRTWMEHLDSQDGVEAAIDSVLGGTYGSAAQGAEYTMGDLVFVSPTEAWFRYDLFANNNRFDDRFGLAVEVDGTWKISRGVICQDLALAGAACEPPIGPLYPPVG